MYKRQIDFPNLMDYIWGDSVNYAFDPNTTLCSENYKGDNGGGTVNPGEPDDDKTDVTLYSANFKTDDGECTLELTKNPSDDIKVWTLTSKYGWKASGFIAASKTNCEADGSVVLPEIDLAGYESAHLSFSHALNFCSVDPETLLAVEVRCEGNTEKLEGINWPQGNSWSYVESGSLDLSKYAGKKIVIAFHYTSTTETAATWEISKASVTGKKTTAAISEAKSDGSAFDPSKPYTVYDLNGRQISPRSTAKGVFVVKQENNTFKWTKH